MTRPDRSLPLRQAPPLHLVACDQVNDRTNERPVSISRSKPGPGPARPGGGFLLLVLSFGSPWWASTGRPPRFRLPRGSP